MLERNRGARRDRTRVKMARSYKALQWEVNLTNFEYWWKSTNHKKTPCHTNECLKNAQAYYLCNEGKKYKQSWMHRRSYDRSRFGDDWLFKGVVCKHLTQKESMEEELLLFLEEITNSPRETHRRQQTKFARPWVLAPSVRQTHPNRRWNWLKGRK